jgi:hypothetical protein
MELQTEAGTPGPIYKYFFVEPILKFCFDLPPFHSYSCLIISTTTEIKQVMKEKIFNKEFQN